MTIYAVPSYRQAVALFVPVESVGRSLYANGVSVDLAETMQTVYRCEIQTAPLELADRAEWRAFRNKLRGGLNLFSAYDASRKNPRNYPDATSAADISGAWDGTATVTTLGAAGALTLGGLPANYVIKADDAIGLEEGGRYDYYAAVADATANGSGAVTVTVSPFLRTGIFTTAAVARLWRPVATFVLDPGSWQEEGGVSPTPISFVGTQRI